MTTSAQVLTAGRFRSISQVQWIRWVVKPLVFVASLVPFALLVHDGVSNNLGANPVEAIRLYTGDWTLRFLLIVLAVTPLRRITGWNAILRLRRMLGLFAFFYACLHFVSYIWLDQHFMFDLIIEDVLDRPYITVGVLGFVLLIPLALTSTNGMIRRLGAKRWRYPLLVAGQIRYFRALDLRVTAHPVARSACVLGAESVVGQGERSLALILPAFNPRPLIG